MLFEMVISRACSVRLSSRKTITPWVVWGGDSHSLDKIVGLKFGNKVITRIGFDRAMDSEPGKGGAVLKGSWVTVTINGVRYSGEITYERYVRKDCNYGIFKWNDGEKQELWGQDLYLRANIRK